VQPVLVNKGFYKTFEISLSGLMAGLAYVPDCQCIEEKRNDNVIMRSD